MPQACLIAMLLKVLLSQHAELSTLSNIPYQLKFTTPQTAWFIAAVAVSQSHIALNRRTLVVIS